MLDRTDDLTAVRRPEVTLEVLPEEPAARPKRLGPLFWIAVGWLLLVTVLALVADLLPLDPNALQDAPGRLPSLDHLLGTDELGRDVLARLIHGARVSLIVGLSAVAFGLLFGGVLGLLAGYFGGKLDTAVSLFVDSVLAFPYLVFALAAVTFLGSGLFVVTLSLGIFAIAPNARVVRAATIQWRNREFVLAAHVLGARTSRILLREVLRNVAPTMLSYVLVAVAFTIVVEGGLSFLGVSVSPPTPSWGGMIAAGSATLTDYPLLSVWPSLAMFFTVLALNVAGDRVQDRFEVREGRL
ncbi:ABC transporter permease [Pseudonocardia nigra]|uniref:ABC transporter permease n=1 Tax=Pseudonocardia nigra TaxID=1921578 RepID=UPI001C5F1646|nr:ABC transporter permease [Pseudonocardia nigra]